VKRSPVPTEKVQLAAVALARPTDASSEALASIPVELQELWWTLMRRNWRSLAIVPTEPGISALAFANEFASIGKAMRGTTVSVVNGENLDLARAAPLFALLLDQLPTQSATSSGTTETRTVVVLDAVVTNPLSVQLAQSADGVLLIVNVGASTTTSVETTVRLLGRERVLGAVMVGQ
jgi:hypothetical protein